MGKLPECQKTSNYLNVSFPFPTCLLNLILNMEISLFLIYWRFPSVTSRKAALACVSCGQKITLKSTAFIWRERGGRQEPRGWITGNFLCTGSGICQESVSGKSPQSRCALGLQSLWVVLKALSQLGQGSQSQHTPSQTLLPPSPQGQGTSEAVPGWEGL